VNYWEVPDEAVEVAVEDPPSAEDRQLRFLLYAGLFDLLVEALWESCEDDRERDRRLSLVLSKFQSVEPTLRFWLFHNSQKAEGLELVTRMRGKDIALHQEWLVPRLERDIGIYRDRIDALKVALGGEAR
jgi:hypothetical protein